ncbi:GNAT family N-acetyltransferase [Paenibacillus pasadenensis]|uniref:GNAT family N-acetyltransferase n=1 Tax=Paenibacillus TaxID=44249 RepID=UPI0003FD8813|nr:GNAT family N-acetyltransferase [Paenibacillus pasadenensis]
MDKPLRLAAPCLELREEYESYYREWLESGETFVPWVTERKPEPFEEMLAWLEERGLEDKQPPGWVPDSTFWLTDGAGRVLGAANLRHRLTPGLLAAGGHVGYGIRPSERGKGYAKALLKLTLEQAAALGVERALLVCDRSNEASARVILACGGVEDEPHEEADGNVVRRFWIGLPSAR